MLGMVADRHLLAELKLPELQERCAIAPNKNLYKLSQMLAEQELATEADNAFEIPVTPTPEELPESRLHRKLHKMPWRRNELTDNESEYHMTKQTIKQKDKVLRKVLEPSGEGQLMANSSLTIMKQKHKKKKMKLERKKFPPDSSDDGSFLSARDTMDNEPAVRKAGNECRAEVSPTKLKSMYMLENRQAISNLSDLSPQQVVPKLEIDTEIFRLFCEQLQQALRIAKQAAKTIGKLHMRRIRNVLLIFIRSQTTGTPSLCYYSWAPSST